MGTQGWIGVKGDGSPFVAGIPLSIVWWVAVTILASWVLTQTRFGN